MTGPKGWVIENGAAPNLDIRLLGASVEFVVGDRLAVLEPGNAAKARNVEQHAAPDHLVPGVLDAELAEAVAIDLARSKPLYIFSW